MDWNKFGSDRRCADFGALLLTDPDPDPVEEPAAADDLRTKVEFLAGLCWKRGCSSSPRVVVTWEVTIERSMFKCAAEETDWSRDPRNDWPRTFGVWPSSVEVLEVEKRVSSSPFVFSESMSSSKVLGTTKALFCWISKSVILSLCSLSAIKPVSNWNIISS